MSNPSRIVTLLTDFGLRDHFVAAIKGVMLSLNPQICFVDISHLIPPQDVFSGAFILGQAYSYFPIGTIHLAVVDPGVGTSRRALVVATAGHFFVAPDNGLLTYVLKGQESYTAYEIAADHYFRKPVSSTFHGRDIFAPVAAWISRDIPLPQFGPAVRDTVRLKIPEPIRVQDALIQGTILAVDQFGNLITNLLPEEVPYTSRILAGKREITSFRTTYAEGLPGEIFAVPGSTGYLEIAVKDGSAAALLNLKSGAPIGVVLE